MSEMQNDALARYYSKKKRRRRRRRVLFYTLLIFFIVMVITVLSLTVFFNIRSITVSGAAHYTSEQIVSASGLETGENMFRIDKFKAIDAIKAKLPYVKEVTVRRRLPGRLVINVVESTPFAYVAWGDKYYILSDTLKVLEAASAPPEGASELVGIVTPNTTVGEIIVADDDAAPVLNMFSALSGSFAEGGVTQIDMSQPYQLSIVYQGRARIFIGGQDNLARKLALVKYVLDENSSNEYAEIDVSSGVRAFYRSVTEAEWNGNTEPIEPVDDGDEPSVDEENDGENGENNE